MLPFVVVGQHDWEKTDWEKDQKIFQERALSTYYSFEVDNVVTIYLEVDTAFERESDGIIVPAPILSNDPYYDWKFDPKKDIRIKGELIMKEAFRDSTSLIFSLRIIEILNSHNIKGFWGEIGDTVSTEIKYLKLE